MARRKKHIAGQGAGSWQGVYASLMTALLTIFIIIFSLSSPPAIPAAAYTDGLRIERVSDDELIIHTEGTSRLANIGGMFGGTDDVYYYMKQMIENQKLEGQVEVFRGEGYVFIRFMEEMLFQPHSARLIDPGNMVLLDYVGHGILSARHSINMVSVMGHGAAVPDNPDNEIMDFDLSGARISATLRYLEEQVGVDPAKLVGVELGKKYPIAENTTQQGISKNRRVEILISTDNPIANQLTDVYNSLIGS